MTPEQELSAAWDARLAGTLSQRDYFDTVERLAPIRDREDGAQVPSTEADEQIRDLRQRRADGKIGQGAYLEAIERLGPLSTSPAVPDLEREAEAMMQPAKSPHEYQLDGRSPLNQEEASADLEIRQSLIAAGIPKHLGGVIVSAIDTLHDRLEGASEEVRASHIQHFQNQLMERWGGDFGNKSQRIQDYLLAIADKSPLFGSLLDERPWAFADIGVSEWLLAVAERQAARAS